MIEPRLFLCSGIQIPAQDPLREGRRTIELDSLGSNANVNIRLEEVAKILGEHLSPRLTDLLEIASYIFTADAATRRGHDWTDEDTTEAWSRDFHFIIPVRDLPFWQSDEVQKLLISILEFVSNDKVTFEFRQLEKERPAQGYLELGDQEDWSFYGVERVLMFSGGLDSLAGIVEVAASGGKLVLVSHSPISTTLSRQRKLFNGLKDKYAIPMIHVPVWINKEENLGREHTQRTRSLLYSAIGTVIAESVKARGVRFFENGIVSMNLPVADEVLRARASRTTHPFTLDLYSKFYRLITEREFAVDNPYLFKTKADVVSVIKEQGAASLIQDTCSCAHTGHFQSSTQWHCGTCSQCIDRRVAIFAAGVEEFDRDTDYVSDVFAGARKDGYEKNMAVNYVRHATELNRMSEVEITTKFPRDFSRAVRNFPRRSEAAARLATLHKRHGETVCRVVSQQLEKHASKLVDGELDKSSLLALVAGQEHLLSSWKQYADRIHDLLSTGVPIACNSKKPDTEPRLQEICDGILKANDVVLIREFPFMRWSSGSTKPDWSAEELKLWVELKYVREKKDISPIREAIAADITKYGDNGRRVLFEVYDPHHLILNDKEFSEPVDKREGMLMRFIH